MIQAIITRFFAMIGVTLVLIAAVLLMQRVVPGDPVRLMVGTNASPAIVEAERKRLGMDKPLPVQYMIYLERLSQGDLQMSLQTAPPGHPRSQGFFSGYA